MSNDETLLAEFDALELHQQLILALLALLGEPTGKTSIAAHLKQARVPGAASDMDAVSSALQQLERQALISEVVGRGYLCGARLRWPALRAALQAHVFGDLCRAVETISPLRESWARGIELRSYAQGLARLRIALLRGNTPQQVVPLLNACLACHEAAQLHPLIEVCARPFEPELIAHIHPMLKNGVLAVLLEHAQREPDSAPGLRAAAMARCNSDEPAGMLPLALAEHLILCGKFDVATDLLQESEDNAMGQLLVSSIALLRGEHAAALAGFDGALKLLRNASGKRKIPFPGIGSHLHVLALLRSSDSKRQKQAQTYLDLVLAGQSNHDSAVHLQLNLLRQVRAGTLQADALLAQPWETQLQAQLFQALIWYWLALPQLAERRAQLLALVRSAEQAGFDFIAAQAAGILGHLGDAEQAEHAETLRELHGFVDLALWFERQEGWQRQLTALINLQQAPQIEGNPSRLVWIIDHTTRHGVTHLEPREQKRGARGAWSLGRAVSLKRLFDAAAQIDFLTPQDVRAAGTIKPWREYYGSKQGYEFDQDKVLVALIGHPLVFSLADANTRVELLAGAPELLIKSQRGQLMLRLQPMLAGVTAEVVITQETPTRLRVIKIQDEHRRIAAIVGKGLAVPLDAKAQVLQAIGAISTLVTVQSDIGGGTDNVAQVDADARLHVHLLPYQQGLKMHILVRPLEQGAYYPPGSGAASVIADVAGKTLQANRKLNAERAAQRDVIALCPVLDEAEQEHGEWLLGQPASCLQLLVELQQLDPDQVVLAWPEGESFKVGKQVEAGQFKLSIKSDKDWFAASGELQIDENRVLDLRALLELMRSSNGRFLALGENEFLALSEQLQRRLQDLAAYGEAHGKGVRVHRLASFALEELAEDAGAIKTDKLWQAHLAKLKDLNAYAPQLPGTLQAELRDYQLAGFEWLARLANWGVGACLADDMGLGKTLQALALMLARAPHGPTLVIAPTSVCMNWISEATRFAPTLNLKLFGASDRQATLAALQPFDVVIASYGLLQQEAALFAGVHWHTIVLDEAQAIKNSATKRSQAVMALQGDFRLVATGTPLENHLGELWNLFRFINPGLLGNIDQFNLRFAGPIERAQADQGQAKAQNAQLAASARTRLRRLIGPFILRRTKAQVLAELPSRTEIVLPIDLSADESALYESLRRMALEKLAAVEGPAAQKSMQILAEIMKLRRVCCNPQLVAPELKLASSKLTAFAQLLDGLLKNRHKVLVFSQFVDHLHLIRDHLDRQAITYQYLDGATPMLARQQRVEAFQRGEGEVFLISLKAGGMGINLTAADYVIHMDPWWNPAVEDQASDRAHRMGQLRPVTIYRLVARHTIEESIVALHRHKRDLADSLLEGTDMAARMSAGDMLQMLHDGLKK